MAGTFLRRPLAWALLARPVGAESTHPRCPAKDAGHPQISWGGPEASWTTQSLKVFDEAFQAACALGVTVSGAAGDNGSSDGVKYGLAHVDFAAFSPNVLACGGSRLMGPGQTITSESIWNDGASGGATGGGSSAFFTPSRAWQSNIELPPLVNPGASLDVGFRMSPATPTPSPATKCPLMDSIRWLAEPALWRRCLLIWWRFGIRDWAKPWAS